MKAEQLLLWDFEHDDPHFQEDDDAIGCYCICYCPKCALEDDIGVSMCICEDCHS